MNDPRTGRQTESTRSLRARRGAEAAVAQYIHELSSRHSGPPPQRADRIKPGRAWCGPEHTVNSPGA
jgi:hypothetical protein